MPDILDTVRNSTLESSRMMQGRKKMPSTSPAQARLMAAAAHTPGGYGGVSQSVGQDFNSADKGSQMLHQALMNRKMRQPTKKPNVPYRKA